MPEAPLDQLGELRHDDEARARGLQPLDRLVVVAPLVAAHKHDADPRRDLREARREEREDPARARDIAGAQFARPEVLRLPLEAAQRVGRGPAPRPWIVADPGARLSAVAYDARGVQVEEQPTRAVWVVECPRGKAIVAPAQLWERDRGQTQEEAPERAGVRVA